MADAIPATVAKSAIPNPHGGTLPAPVSASSPLGPPPSGSSVGGITDDAVTVTVTVALAHRSGAVVAQIEYVKVSVPVKPGSGV